jgi:uncharacterized protein YggE
MSTSHFGVQILSLVLAGIIPPSVQAQSAYPGTVTAHGMAEIKRQPEFLRVQIDLLAKGKTLKEALAKLKERKQLAQKSLEILGVAAKDVEFGEPGINADKNERQRRMAMMMMQQARIQGKKPPQKAKEPPPVVVYVQLTAELPLRASASEELLMAAHAIEEQIKNADLGGTKDLKQASPQDEELEQEMAEEMMGMEDGEPKKGVPVFLYVSKISEEEQGRALAQAFKKAQRQAGELAKAAGATLGAIRDINENETSWGSTEQEGMDNSYVYRMGQMMSQMRGGRGEGDDVRHGEAVGFKPGKVTYRIMVSASFELKKPPVK